MKKRLYRGPGATAAPQVDIFDSAVYLPVRDQEKNNGINEGGPDDDEEEE